MTRRLLLVLIVLVIGALAWMVLTSEPGGAPGPETDEPVGTDPAPERQRARTAPPAVAPEPEPEATMPEDVPDEETALLHVTVLAAESGAPLENARVTLAEGRSAARETRTDGDGRARFDPAPAAEAEIVAHAPGHVRDYATWSPGEPLEVMLRLARGTRLTGRVEDRDGRPLADAAIDLIEGGSMGGISSISAGPELGRATTDAAGQFRLDGVPTDEMITVGVTCTGFVRHERTVRLAAGDEGPALVIRLAPGGAVTGTVRGPDLAPVAGATVHVAAADSEFLLDDPDMSVLSTGASQSRAFSAVTDAAGRYRVDGLALDAPYVVVAALPGVGRSERARDVVARESAPVASVDLALRPSLDLAIRVVDAAGEPIDSASVLCLTGRFHQVIRSADGAFRIPGLEPGDVVCDVDADGFVKQRVTHALERSGELVVRLERGLSIAGIAVNDAGEPLPNARIRCMRPLGNLDLPGSLADGTTDTDGRFEVGGLRDGPHAVLCWAEGHAKGVAEPIQAGARDVRVVAPRDGTVVMRLRLPPGAPPPAKLQRQIRREGGGTGTELDWPEDGRLEVSVPAMPATLILVVPGYADVPFELEVSPGETRDLGVVRLGPGLAATGRVTDPGGRPVPGVEIRAVAAWALEGHMTTTDAEGRFRLPRLAPAEYELHVTARGFLERWLTRDTRTSIEWDLTLARGALVHGTLRDPGGVGVPDGAVWLVALDGEDADERTELTHPDNAGRYALRVLPGRYRVEYRAEDDGAPVVGREVALTEGAEEAIDFLLGD